VNSSSTARSSCYKTVLICHDSHSNFAIKPDAIEEYEREHQRVWPELLAKLKQVGISDYSIFRRGQELVLSLRVDDFDKAWDELDRDPVNLRWQQLMSRLFEPVPDLQPGERFAMMKEVFGWSKRRRNWRRSGRALFHRQRKLASSS